MICENPMVLVVEDDREMNDLECQLLQMNGFRTCSAYDGSEALSQYSDLKPDAVLLDVMLPGVDGFETCRTIRQELNSNTPVIMLSALSQDNSRETGNQSGANAYLTKPFDVDEVIGTLNSFLPHAGHASA